MLNPFPSLLLYAFFAPTLLRLSVAAVLGYMAFVHYQNRAAITRTRFPVIGEGGWVWVVGALLELLLAVALFFGYDTQWAALLCALLSLKYAFWAGKYPSYFVLSRPSALLMFAICASLLLSGAGGMAYDLPL